MFKRFLIFIILSLISSAPANEKVSFNKDVLPILSDKCFHCHGQDESHRKAKLRLDTFEGATSPNKKKKFAIVPGKPFESLVYKLITTDDEDDIMPPEDTDKKLTKAEKEIIYKWIKSGAKYERHWSFVKPVKEALPTVKNTQWAKIDFDYYVLENLEKKGLKPSPEAAAHTLIRRVHLDLTGLPPDPKIVKTYEMNPSVANYETIVDRLLKSEAYAERMAMVWMDAARYSDSDGFQQDSTRQSWPWKDWVINAYKKNMPFDQFTIEQVAGDLLPKATADQILATSFNRHHMTNGEGGRDPEESRIDYVMDRATTVATTWLGLTVGCAQCHDHKFDPVSQKEFYRMNAFFNSIDEDGKAGRGAKPHLKYKPALVIAGKKDASDWLSTVKVEENQLISHTMKGYDEWLSKKAQYVSKKAKFSSWQKVDAVKLKTANGSILKQIGPGEFAVSGKNPRHEDYTITSSPALQQLTGLRVKVKVDKNNSKGGFSKANDGHVNLTNLKVFIRSKSTGTQKGVTLASAKATHNKRVKGKKYGAVRGILDDDPRTGWVTDGAKFKEQVIVVSFVEAQQLDNDKEVIVELKHRSLAGHESMRRFNLEFTGEFGNTSKTLGETASEKLARVNGDVSKITSKDNSNLKEEFLYSHNVLIAARKKVQEAGKAVDSYNSYAKHQNVMVMKERAKPRTTHVLIRGVWDKKGEAVNEGVPERIAPWPSGAPKNRLGLARWLVNKKNPLTARVTVNRYWQMIFGAGLVRTPEDFGLQGERPEYPEVLDWLAVEFMENDWNVKHILKTIVMSKTYSQSSLTNKELIQKDPLNKLLARASRYRMPSWMIRDTILESTGLLTKRFGGPPVYPYQPHGAWRDSTMGRFRYTVSPGKDAYRRSLYTFWRRSVGPTNMYDSSKRRNCSIRAVRTNTPLHALNLMNDQSFVEAARILSKASLLKPDSTRNRLNYMGLRIISRKFTDSEITVLKSQLDDSLKWFTANEADAKELLNHGQINLGAAKNKAAEVAAYLTVAQTILNLDEAINRE